MQNLFRITAKKEFAQNFTKGEKLSVIYHDIFDYPLTIAEMIRWRASENLNTEKDTSISGKNGFYYIEGKNGLIYKRALRKRVSERKMEIAKKASKLLSLIPTIKMVGVTGSLAMENSSDESDIDLMIITKKGTLWTTRLIALIALKGKIRRAGSKEQKDKLCLNIWMDEGDLVWKKQRNIYTAHEIGQIIPLINKDKIHQKLLWQNKWILKYWPNSVKVEKIKTERSYGKTSLTEFLAYKLQLFYMKPKITREYISPTRALFHPVDWGKVILDRLNSNFIQ